MNYQLLNKMKHSIRLFFTIIFINTSLSILYANEKGEIIENELYTFIVPENWEPYNQTEGYIPLKRGCGPYDLYYLTWTSPIKSFEDIPNTITLSIDSYSKKDKTDISMEDIIKFELEMESKKKLISTQETKVSNYKKKIIYIHESTEMDEKIIYYKICLYEIHQKTVHSVKILLGEKIYKTKGIQVTIDEILQSFKIRR